MSAPITIRLCITTCRPSSPKPSSLPLPATPTAPHRFYGFSRNAYRSCETPRILRISAIWSFTTSSRPFTKIRARANALKTFRFHGNMPLPPTGSPLFFVRLCPSDCWRSLTLPWGGCTGWARSFRASLSGCSF